MERNEIYEIVTDIFRNVFDDEDIELKNETNAEDMFSKIKKEVDKEELTNEEKEYVKAHIKEWVTDDDLNHDLQRHIFQKLLNNKEKVLKQLEKKS